MKILGFIADFVWSISFGLYVLLSKNIHAILGLFCILIIFIGFYTPFSIASIFLIGSGLGGLLALWRVYHE